MFKVPNKFRMRLGPQGSDDGYGCNGIFIIPNAVTKHRHVIAIASDGMGWEHVSVHIEQVAAVGRTPSTRTPLWEEMCWVKDTFWDAGDCVIQYHPARSNYVNVHPNVLHLWRPSDQIAFGIPVPPIYLV